MKPSFWNHWKLIAFAQAMGIGKPEALGIIQATWLIVGERSPYDETGELPCPAKALGMVLGTQLDGQSIVDAMLSVQLLDKTEGRLVVHDWEENRPDYIRKRVADRTRIAEKRQNATIRDNPRQPATEGDTPRQKATKSDVASTRTRTRTRTRTQGKSKVGISCSDSLRTDNRARGESGESETRKADHFDFSKVEIPESDFWHAVSLAQAADRKLPLRTNQDRQVVARAALLAITRFGEHWFHDAVEGVRQTSPAKPMAYFVKLLQREAEYDQVCRTVRVPKAFYDAMNRKEGHG